MKYQLKENGGRWRFVSAKEYGEAYLRFMWGCNTFLQYPEHIKKFAETAHLSFTSSNLCGRKFFSNRPTIECSCFPCRNKASCK